MIKYSPTINPGDVIAVGDIHGRYDLFDNFLARVKDSQATIILLGDIIDRGPDDVKVLERTKQLLDDPESNGLANFFCLMGNHEAMMVDAYEGPSSSLLMWLQNGGNLEDLQEIHSHVGWVQNLPIYMTLGDTLFIHAGIFPGHDPLKAVESGRSDSLLWMREPFLTMGPQFEKWNPNLKRVVHGHTPYFEDELLGKPNISSSGDRIGIDSGAYFTGILTSYNATQNTLWTDYITKPCSINS
jgi:serine/threonine protein phosphatase 1